MREIVTNDAIESASMVSLAKSPFNDFLMHNGDTVIQTQRRFDQMVNECIIQDLTVPKAEKTSVLLTHPMDKWRLFVDSYAIQTLAPTADSIFWQFRLSRRGGILATSENTGIQMMCRKLWLWLWRRRWLQAKAKWRCCSSKAKSKRFKSLLLLRKTRPLSLGLLDGGGDLHHL